MDKLQTTILGYQPSGEVKKLLKETKILLLVGPTASGKNTLMQELLKTGNYRPIISHTTRPPRFNHGRLEKEGDEYHFITETKAQEMLNNHEFIEAALTHGHVYGTSVQEFRNAKEEAKIAVTDIDIKGVRSYRQLSGKVISIFLLPPSFTALIDRLISRYGKSHNQEYIKVRLATALDELYELIDSDYYYLVINDHIDKTTKKVLEIVAGRVNLKPNSKALNLAQTLIDDIKKYLATQ